MSRPTDSQRLIEQLRAQVRDLQEQLSRKDAYIAQLQHESDELWAAVPNSYLEERNQRLIREYLPAFAIPDHVFDNIQWSPPSSPRSARPPPPSQPLPDEEEFRRHLNEDVEYISHRVANPQAQRRPSAPHLPPPRPENPLALTREEEITRQLTIPDSVFDNIRWSPPSSPRSSLQPLPDEEEFRRQLTPSREDVEYIIHRVADPRAQRRHNH